MALDPRLMRVDYSPLVQAGQAIGQGIDSRLAGKALMGDPADMENLKRRNPMMAVEIQGKLAEQKAAQQQRDMQKMDWITKNQERFGKMLANTRNPEEAKRMHERLSATDPAYQMLNKMAVEQGIDTDFNDDDFLEVKLQYGTTGFGGMELDKLLDFYNNREPVKDLESTMAAMEGIKDNYARFKDGGGVASAAAIGKQAIQLVEKGVVRGDEAKAFGGLGLPVDENGNVALKGEALEEFIQRWAQGALQGNQVDSLAQMAIDVYNAKVDTVSDLQARMEDRGLGSYDPETIFISTGRQPKKMENFVKMSNWDDADRAMYEEAMKNPESEKSKEAFKLLGL